MEGSNSSRMRERILCRSAAADARRSEAATTAAGLAARAVSRDRRHVLDAAGLDAGTRDRAESRLRTWSRALRLRAADSTELDVNAADVQLLEARRNILRRQHRCVRRRLVTISLHLHAAGDANKSLAAGKVRNVDERVVERREDVADANSNLPLTKRRTQLDLFRLLFLLLSRRHISHTVEQASSLEP